VLPGDDSSHALLVASHRNARAEGTVFELEADRAPLEVRRANGDPIGEIDAAVHAAGRWYVATSSAAGAGTPGPLQAVVWQLDGPVAHELARIPRTPLPDGRVGAGRLALRADGGALGYVVDGEPSADRAEPTRWVAPIDLDTGAIGDVEPLGSSDFGDRSSLGICTMDDPGWSMDLPLDGTASVPIWLSTPGGFGGLHGVVARVRVAPSRACVERLAGTLGQSVDSFGQRSPPSGPALTVPVTVGDRRERRIFHCGVR
jgi:hypothetical protein